MAKVAESVSKWLPWREFVSLVMLLFGYMEEYTWVWSIREAAGGRIKTRGENVSILSVAWRGVIVFDRLVRRKKLLSAISVIDSRPIKRRRKLVLATFPVTSVGMIDRYSGTLRLPGEPGEIISNVEFCIDGLVTPARLPAPRDNTARREMWSAARLYAEMIGDEIALTPEMGPKLLPAQLELSRQIRAGLITPWDMSKPDEPKRVPLDRFRLSKFWGTTIVSVHGQLTNWPAPKNEGNHACRIMFYADEGKRVFPRLDWLREEAKRSAAVARAWLTKLNDLIALNEANGPDWKRFIELVAMIGGNLENLTAEEAAAVRLVDGFSSVQANAELLYEAKKIRRCIGDRLAEAVHASQLVITGYRVSDLTVPVTIPGHLVTTDQIWLLLRSGELPIGERYVGARIGLSKRPEVPPHAVGPSGQRADQPSAVSSPSETASSPLVDETATSSQPEPILPADTAAAEVSTTEAQIEGAEAPQIRPPEPAEQQPEAATSSPELEPIPPAKQVSREDLREAIDQIPPEWILEPGRTEKEIQDRIEQIAGGAVSREWMREELKARVPGKNRGRGRPRT
jgi:hypothetical protein